MRERERDSPLGQLRNQLLVHRTRYLRVAAVGEDVPARPSVIYSAKMDFGLVSGVCSL
jgi:hypothetical protein